MDGNTTLQKYRVTLSIDFPSYVDIDKEMQLLEEQAQASRKAYE